MPLPNYTTHSHTRTSNLHTQKLSVIFTMTNEVHLRDSLTAYQMKCSLASNYVETLPINPKKCEEEAASVK